MSGFLGVIPALLPQLNGWIPGGDTGPELGYEGFPPIFGQARPDVHFHDPLPVSGSSWYHAPLAISKGRQTMARPGTNHSLRWRSKRANKGRKPSKGKVKGWGVKNYPHLYG